MNKNKFSDESLNRDIVSALNANNIKTIASCCGHSKIDGTIILEDGRMLIIKKDSIL